MKIDRLQDATWLLRVRDGEPPIILADAELTDLAEALCFRLAAVDIIRTGSGVCARVGDGRDAYIHLAYTDEADDLIEKIRLAAS